MKKMINFKTKVISESYAKDFENELSNFLKTIDARQIVKMEYTTIYSTLVRHSVMIIYLDMSDIRELNIDRILK